MDSDDVKTTALDLIDNLEKYNNLLSLVVTSESFDFDENTEFVLGLITNGLEDNLFELKALISKDS